MMMQAENPKEHITVKDLTMAYGDYVLQNNLNFSINKNDIFIIMGGSGCGKSTLLKYMIGLRTPEQGNIYYNGVDFYKSSPEEQESIMRSFGILYQSSALWSSMTL
jgi:phospholipid/cholesterol/gamma-HCH transport system ATP-binding protein